MIDDFCKQLVARHPASVGRWLLAVTGHPQPLAKETNKEISMRREISTSKETCKSNETSTSEKSCTSKAAFASPSDQHAARNTALEPHQLQWTLLDRELSSDPLHADSVILLPAGRTGRAPILHLEFQTRPDRTIAERMLEYWIRLHRRFGLPIRQVVIHLKPTTSSLARIEQLAIGDTRHRFTSLRLWEQDPEPLLADPALLPLAVLARGPSEDPARLLERVRRKLQTIADAQQRRRITSGAQLLAGLTFPQDVIQRLLAMSILEDSSVYQYIVRKGMEEGRLKGLEQGRQLEAANLILRLIERRWGPLEEAQRQSIAVLPLQRLEALAEALLDFNNPEDLLIWLR